MFKNVIANLYVFALSDTTEKYISKVEYTTDKKIFLTIGENRIPLLENCEINPILITLGFNVTQLIGIVCEIHNILGDNITIDLVNSRVEF